MHFPLQQLTLTLSTMTHIYTFLSSHFSRIHCDTVDVILILTRFDRLRFKPAEST